MTEPLVPFSNLQTVFDHIDAVVRPALRKYVEAENGLTSTPQARKHGGSTGTIGPRTPGQLSG